MSEFPTPNADEAERWVVSAMFRSRVARDEIPILLRPEHFRFPAHQIVFKAIVDRHAAQQGIDVHQQ